MAVVITDRKEIAAYKNGYLGAAVAFCLDGDFAVAVDNGAVDGVCLSPWQKRNGSWVEGWSGAVGVKDGNAARLAAIFSLAHEWCLQQGAAKDPDKTKEYSPPPEPGSRPPGITYGPGVTETYERQQRLMEEWYRSISSITSESNRPRRR